MEARTLTYFVADVHLGLDVKDPDARERRFVDFLRGIPAARTEALYLLGDIWDFWFEYRDVAPTGYARVFSALMDLMDAGVRVYFFRGNHDIWLSGYFERLGMTVLEQPYVVQIGTKTLCLGHGDGLGPGMYAYKLMRAVFRSRFCRALYSLLPPRLAYAVGEGWSRRSRLARSREYTFRGPDESLYKWAEAFSEGRHVDAFIFGHYHTDVHLTLPGGAELFILKDWMDGAPYKVLDRTLDGVFGNSPKIE